MTGVRVTLPSGAVAVVIALAINLVDADDSRVTATSPMMPPAASCSGHLSNVIPPDLIRVWDNMGYVDGGFHWRPFKDYVKEVLWREWNSSWAMASLQSGAMAVIHYGWYRADYFGPRYAGGECFDIATSEQRWEFCPPEGCPASTNEAVESVFRVGRMYRPEGGSGRVLHALYLAGDPPPEIDGDRQDACGELYWSQAPGHTMSQYGSESCARVNLYVWNAIARRYYFDNTTDPGHVTVLDDAPGATSFYLAGEGHRLHVYAVARNGTLYQNVWVPSGQYWGGWFPFVGSFCTSAPSAAGFGSDHLWVFCRGQNGAIYGNRWNGSSWLGWQSLGSTVQSGPGATDYCLPSGQCQLAVYALGWDGNIYENFCRLSEGCIWQGWVSMGSPAGGCTSAPAASWRNGYERYVFCRGANAAIWYKKWNGYNWEAWATRGGELDSGPGTTDYYLSGEGWRLYHLSNIELGNIYVEWKTGSGWSGRQYFGGVCQSSPGASDVLGRVYLFFLCRGQDDSVWYSRWSGSSWDPWQSIGRP